MSKIGNTFLKRKNKLLRSYEKIRFNLRLNRKTQSQRKQIVQEAEVALSHADQYETAEAYLASTDPLVQQGFILKQEVCQSFKDRYRNQSDERILIHVPDAHFSPAGYSIFTNLAESLSYIGIPTAILEWNADIDVALAQFMPTTFLTSDHFTYLERINWLDIQEYKKRLPLKIGLTTSLEEYDNTPLMRRLQWAQQNEVDFFYSFRDEEYVHSRAQYRPYFEQNFPVLFLPFSANILHYYPVPGFKRDLNFALMASRKREHISYLKEIAAHYSGYIDGPGWQHVTEFTFNRDRDRYIYARTKVGLNVHLPEQLDWACELNERTYQLAACGVPQLIDHPKLIDKLFSPESMFIANNPKEYTALFQELIHNPELGQRKALLAQQEVFAKHTSLHKASAFIDQLSKLIS